MNPFGLHDMQGNVIEWVQDCYHDNYDGAPEDGSAWQTDCAISRVLRGGKWNDHAEKLRSARRKRDTPTFSGIKIGFRVARTLKAQ